MGTRGMRKVRLGWWVVWLALVLAAGEGTAQGGDRTIEEIRVEAEARAERGAYPLNGLYPNDVHEALASIKSRNPDEWATAFSTLANRYLHKAKAAPNQSEADANFLRACASIIS